MAATVLEECKINPPAESSPPEFVLPIVFFDMVWYDFPANQSVLFFDLPEPCSTKPYFLETLVPDLKSSLSLTLREFLPLAGKIVHPLTPGDKPILRYESGDSVSFNVCESGADFSELVGNHPRNCDDFYAFVPNLPPANRSEKSICCPVLALQVTLFPGHGFCIGFVTHHTAAMPAQLSLSSKPGLSSTKLSSLIIIVICVIYPHDPTFCRLSTEKIRRTSTDWTR
ncbi:hypothetical protein ABFS83_14G286800 [Erythranthe nasuta]